jgi:DtxR family Mn-dependent transcriptional regulator
MVDPLTALMIAFFVAAIAFWLFWPEKGLFWRWQHARQMTRRVLIEDTLKHLHDCEYQGRVPTVQSIAGVLNTPVDGIAELLTDMQAHGLIEFAGDRINLTTPGRDYALHIIRAHRLWEHYLAEKTGYDQADWHSQSERREHQLSRAEAEALAIELGHPLYDPHGDPIPTASGDLVSPEQITLPNFPLHRPGRIVHLEDEPETVYAQLVAEGLYPGLTVLVTQATTQRVRFWANGDEHVLAPIVAANISVMACQPREEQQDQIHFERLNNLRPNETGRVVSISQNCRGAERRRFMDLGILPGTVIKAEMTSPSGDPTAYRIRGALIGLRQEQAAWINISRDLEPVLNHKQELEVNV